MQKCEIALFFFAQANLFNSFADCILSHLGRICQMLLKNWLYNTIVFLYFCADCTCLLGFWVYSRLLFSRNSSNFSVHKYRLKITAIFTIFFYTYLFFLSISDFSQKKSRKWCEILFFMNIFLIFLLNYFDVLFANNHC